MYTLIWCILIACLFPYLSRVPVLIAMSKEPKGYNNYHPRAQQAALKGFGARAVAAHQNSFESLIVFLAGALTALASQQTTPMIQGLAIFYLMTRVIYHLLYLLNWAALRSLVWALGFLSSLSMIFLCIP